MKVSIADYLHDPVKNHQDLKIPFRNDGVANPFGIRTLNRNAGKYDDILGVWWVESDGLVTMTSVLGTVDPGSHYLENPTNRKRGTLVLAAGHYPLVFKVGNFRNEPALLQQGYSPFKFHLDNNRDAKIDLTSQILSGWKGVHWHRPFESGEDIGLSSAGCQVTADVKEHRAIMKRISDRSIIRDNEKFVDYSLFEEK